MSEPTMRPRLLDLFCCEGGAATGYRRAGFDVVGVDLSAGGGPHRPNPGKRYPFEFHQADALEFLAERGQEFDAVHASPPCQSYSRAMRHLASPTAALLEPTREALVANGRPWVLENVPGAPMFDYAEMCGCMFGMKIRRERWFETSFTLRPPTALHRHNTAAMNPHYAPSRDAIGLLPERQWRHEMGVEWMTQAGAREAIPPVFTEWIGGQLFKRVMDRGAAA